MNEADVLLEATGLKKWFPVTGGLFRRHIGDVRAVDGVDLRVGRRETVGVVGESGCGKSTLARTLLKLTESTAGTIRFDGLDITHLTRKQMAPLRSRMRMIFQDPYGSLNPRHSVSTIIGESFRAQRRTPPGGLTRAVSDLMDRVGLNPDHYNRYPLEFSGGQRQRIGIARAIAMEPEMIVADEPVSALDVSIQAQILNLLIDLQEDLGLSYVLIAHDLSVIEHIADRVVVMYLGHVVEHARTESLYAAPRHPYTRALLSAAPTPDPDVERARHRILLAGDLPSPADPPSGCVFRTRCPKATTLCAMEAPVLAEITPGHTVACHFPEDPPVRGQETPHE